LGISEVIVAAIPVRNKLEWTAPLVQHLLVADQIDELWLYDNGSTDRTAEWANHLAKYDPRLKYIDAKDYRLYDMWNRMISDAAKYDEANLAILNNDIRLGHNALWHMARMMREQDYQMVTIDPSRPAINTPTIIKYGGQITTPVDPYLEQVTAKHRVGWAFMVQAEFWADEPYAIHPDYKIWYGDDDLFIRCEQRGGRIAWARGIGCDHAMEQSDSEYPAKWDHAAEDKNTFRNMWGHL
jgi:GT2 family glycosyltransferase